MANPKINHIHQQFERIKKGAFSNKDRQNFETMLRKLEKTVNSCIEDAKKDGDDRRLKNGVENSHQLKKLREQWIVFQLQQYNQQNNTDYSYEELCQFDKGLLWKKDFMAFMNENFLLSKSKKERLLQEFPTNPKDDYPETREMKRHFIIHTGATNTGKTYNALQRLKQCEKGTYLGPLRLLALEIYERLNGEDCPCSLRTGEEEIITKNAKVISSTIEMAQMDMEFDVAVIDECQLMADEYRGAHWTKAVLGLKAKEIHICCSLNAVLLLKNIIKDLGDTLEVHQYERKTPLELEETLFDFPRDVREGDALVVFSRKKVLQIATMLKEQGIAASVLYGNLPPNTRRKQIERFLAKETKVVVTTDCIGLGVNLPIQRVVFMELEKYDGKEVRLLKSQEVKQIAGRAGRQGIYPVGYVATVYDKEFIRTMLYEKDSPITKAYVLPDRDTLLAVQLPTLFEKLNRWKQFTVKMRYYEKANIDNEIELLNTLYDEYLLTQEREMVQMITTPFDLKNGYLKEIWLQYCRDIIEGEPFMFPSMEDDSLEGFELYYAKLDLYFSMSKAFRREFNDEKVALEKENTSTKIDEMLIQKILTKQSKCLKCKEVLSIGYTSYLCQKCFNQLKF